MEELQPLLNELNITLAELQNKSRHAELVLKRRLFAVYLRNRNYTLQAIAQILHRDHTTIQYYIKLNNAEYIHPAYHTLYTGITHLLHNFSQETEEMETHERTSRAISLATGLWVYGYYVKKNGVPCIISTEYNKYITEKNRTKPIDATTLGHYTGKQDCNGTKIYTGDIFSYELKAEVYYCNHKAAYMVKFHNLPEPYEPILLSQYIKLRTQHGKTYEDCTIIGNTIDNPEILRKHKMAS